MALDSSTGTLYVALQKLELSGLAWRRALRRASAAQARSPRFAQYEASPRNWTARSVVVKSLRRSPRSRELQDARLTASRQRNVEEFHVRERCHTRCAARLDHLSTGGLASDKGGLLLFEDVNKDKLLERPFDGLLDDLADTGHVELVVEHSRLKRSGLRGTQRVGERPERHPHRLR